MDEVKALGSRPETVERDHVLATITHPDEIVELASMTELDKRSALASWASDQHTVEGAPALRQLESGAIVHVHDVLSALKRLDALKLGQQPVRRMAEISHPRRERSLAARLRAYIARRRRRTDDDDDPPPSAVALAAPRRHMMLAVSH